MILGNYPTYPSPNPILTHTSCEGKMLGWGRGRLVVFKNLEPNGGDEREAREIFNPVPTSKEKTLCERGLGKFSADKLRLGLFLL